MTADLVGLSDLLTDCKMKLGLYHEATNGEYPGGTPMQILVPRIVSAIAELRALAGAEVGGWLPIDSAPLDGSPMLVCYAPQYDTNGFLPVAVRWRNYHPNAQGKEAFRQSNGNKVEVMTHWQPLPPPPGSGRGGD